jgi:hypothetical protein
VTTIVIGFLMILPLVFHFQLFLHFTFLHFTSNAPVAFLTIPKGTSRISFGQHCGLTTDGTQNDGAACNKILNQSHTAGQVEACPLLSLANTSASTELKQTTFFVLEAENRRHDSRI